MSTYLYGVVRWPVPWARSGATPPAKTGGGDRALGEGVGDPAKPVELLPHRDLAAVVSTVAAGEVGGQDVRALRQDMKAHSAVLNRIVELDAPSLLPVRFGVVLPNARALVERILEPKRQVLLGYLDRLEGAAEVSLKVTYIEERVLQEVVAEQPQLARRAGAREYQSRIDVGRQVAAALRARQGRDAAWLLDRLQPVVRDVRAATPASDLMVLNASLLVGQKELPKFDRALEKLTAEVGHLMRFDCVGPLPPYSFADLRL